MQFCRKGASEQTLDLVAQWWRIFDEYSIEKLLDGFVLDRDWTRVSQSLETLYAYNVVL